jgi:hypothetical protein
MVTRAAAKAAKTTRQNEQKARASAREQRRRAEAQRLELQLKTVASESLSRFLDSVSYDASLPPAHPGALYLERRAQEGRSAFPFFNSIESEGATKGAAGTTKAGSDGAVGLDGSIAGVGSNVLESDPPANDAGHGGTANRNAVPPLHMEGVAADAGAPRSGPSTARSAAAGGAAATIPKYPNRRASKADEPVVGRPRTHADGIPVDLVMQYVAASITLRTDPAAFARLFLCDDVRGIITDAFWLCHCRYFSAANYAANAKKPGSPGGKDGDEHGEEEEPEADAAAEAPPATGGSRGAGRGATGGQGVEGGASVASRSSAASRVSASNAYLALSAENEFAQEVLAQSIALASYGLLRTVAIDASAAAAEAATQSVSTAGGSLKEKRNVQQAFFEALPFAISHSVWLLYFYGIPGSRPLFTYRIQLEIQLLVARVVSSVELAPVSVIRTLDRLFPEELPPAVIQEYTTIALSTASGLFATGFRGESAPSGMQGLGLGGVVGSGTLHRRSSEGAIDGTSNNDIDGVLDGTRRDSDSSSEEDGIKSQHSRANSLSGNSVLGMDRSKRRNSGRPPSGGSQAQTQPGTSIMNGKTLVTGSFGSRALLPANRIGFISETSQDIEKRAAAALKKREAAALLHAKIDAKEKEKQGANAPAAVNQELNSNVDTRMHNDKQLVSVAKALGYRTVYDLYKTTTASDRDVLGLHDAYRSEGIRSLAKGSVLPAVAFHAAVQAAEKARELREKELLSQSGRSIMSPLTDPGRTSTAFASGEQQSRTEVVLSPGSTAAVPMSPSRRRDAEQLEDANVTQRELKKKHLFSHIKLKNKEKLLFGMSRTAGKEAASSGEPQPIPGVHGPSVAILAPGTLGASTKAVKPKSATSATKRPGSNPLFADAQPTPLGTPIKTTRAPGSSPAAAVAAAALQDLNAVAQHPVGGPINTSFSTPMKSPSGSPTLGGLPGPKTPGSYVPLPMSAYKGDQTHQPGLQHTVEAAAASAMGRTRAGGDASMLFSPGGHGHAPAHGDAHPHDQSMVMMAAGLMDSTLLGEEASGSDDMLDGDLSSAAVRRTPLPGLTQRQHSPHTEDGEQSMQGRYTGAGFTTGPGIGAVVRSEMQKVLAAAMTAADQYYATMAKENGAAPEGSLYLGVMSSQNDRYEELLAPSTARFHLQNAGSLDVVATAINVARARLMARKQGAGVPLPPGMTQVLAVQEKRVSDAIRQAEYGPHTPMHTVRPVTRGSRGNAFTTMSDSRFSSASGSAAPLSPMFQIKPVIKSAVHRGVEKALISRSKYRPLQAPFVVTASSALMQAAVPTVRSTSTGAQLAILRSVPVPWSVSAGGVDSFRSAAHSNEVSTDVAAKQKELNDRVSALLQSSREKEAETLRATANRKKAIYKEDPVLLRGAAIKLAQMAAIQKKKAQENAVINPMD